MNKLFLGVLAFAALMFYSCSEDNDSLNDAASDAVVDKNEDTPENNGNSETVTFSAALEQKAEVEQNEASSRTTVEFVDNKGIVKWASGDQISILDGSNQFSTFTLSQGAGTTVAKFTGSFSSGVTGGDIAVYPAGAHKYDGTTLTVNLPSTYGDTNTPYSENTNVLMLATKPDYSRNLYFKHLGGVVCVTVNVPANTNKVSLTAKGICGDFTLDPKAADVQIVQAADAKDETVSHVFKAVESATAMTFYFPLPTGTYPKFILTVAGNEGTDAKVMDFGTTGASLSRTDIPDLGVLTILEFAHTCVDLGLPDGTLWATCNVGAESPEDYGDYFAWGEIIPQSTNTYGWGSYKWGNGVNTESKFLTKYVIQSQAETYGNNGFYDDKTQLDLEDDAAYMNWGGDWRMPTADQIAVLLANTTKELVERTNSNGETVKGYLYTSTVEGYTDRSIFLPLAGYYQDNKHYKLNGDLSYWGSTLATAVESIGAAQKISIRGSYLGGNQNAGNEGKIAGAKRRCGQSVRPVRVVSANN